MSKKHGESEMEVEDEDTTDGNKIQLPLEAIQDESERRDIRKNYRDFISSLQGNQQDLANPSSDSLNEKLLEADKLYEPVRMTREAALDSQALVLIANIGRQKAQALNTEFVRFQPVEFAEKLMTFVSGLDAHDDSGISRQGWCSLGQAVQPFFRRMPAFHFMAGSFERGPVQIKKNVGARKGLSEKEQTEDKATVPKQMEDFNDSDKNEATTAEVERVHRRLLEVYNEYNKLPICYFEFVTNPHSFGKTIENMFHVSFLVRDGYAKIFLDEDKLPVIEPIEVAGNMTEEERIQSKRQQVIISLTKQDWQEIIKNFNIQEPVICDRPSAQSQISDTSSMNSSGVKPKKK
ncbi:EP300-interacting inhibitor of differentiation 3-like [Gigantopelta aegis]|uniref:EP300-interacting inhibitor of differentiation 3-like n=1 Tax=Gigantopelta aegis TaxID=1735272 RepID=UPI001B88BF3C|nr:EP300-interacting inhibitor of differentiation 3-like [Gigantopelta aegis]